MKSVYVRNSPQAGKFHETKKLIKKKKSDSGDSKPV